MYSHNFKSDAARNLNVSPYIDDVLLSTYFAKVKKYYELWDKNKTRF